MTPIILDTARHASPAAPFGGLLFGAVVRVIYGRTRPGRAAAARKAIRRRDHPPSAEIAHNWMSDRMRKGDER